MNRLLKIRKPAAVEVRQPRGALKATVIMPVLLSVSSLGLTYWLVRRVRRRWKQSQLLRSHPVPIQPSALVPGDFVALRGTVDADLPLSSPDKGIPCVRFARKKLRLVDQRTGATTWTHGVHGESSRGFWKLFNGVSQLFSPMHTKFGGGVSTSRELYISSSRHTLLLHCYYCCSHTTYAPVTAAAAAATVTTLAQSKKEAWGMVYQEVASEEGTAAIIKLTGPNGSIALDLAGAEFLELETVEEEFQP
eukprot:20526-Heterococcus_DN1.PRE.1